MSTDLHDSDEIITSPPTFGRVVVPVPNKHKPGKKTSGVWVKIVPSFRSLTWRAVEYTEHVFIGDSIQLTLADGGKRVASDIPISLPNGLTLTYSQINALSGDFYGTKYPISDGKDDQDRSDRFVAAFRTLADPDPRQPKEANELLKVLKIEVDEVNKALKTGKDPSEAYLKVADQTKAFISITKGRKSIPGYLELALINWDHFGEGARIAYNTGHATAIRRAIGGDLLGAYSMNAFADHFLEDSFSAGHLRTPRKRLHELNSAFADYCAKVRADLTFGLKCWRFCSLCTTKTVLSGST
jgi:hypothetical protein